MPRWPALLLASALCAAPAAARADDEEAPKPFPRGTNLFGAFLGIGAGAGRTDLAFGASYGRFVVDGVAPGLSAVVTASTAVPTTVELAPFLRVVLWNAYPVSPFLLAKGGRLFINDLPDLWLVGGGGGVAWFTTARVSLTLQALYLRYLGDTCDPCDTTSIGAGIGLSF